MDAREAKTLAAKSQASNCMADISFAQMMIPLREQAVVMPEYALTNTDNAQVLVLAREILDARGPEIERMNAILDRFESNTRGHEGAIDMAEDVLAPGAELEVRILAEMIVTGQQDEIDTMQELLANSLHCKSKEPNMTGSKGKQAVLRRYDAERLLLQRSQPGVCHRVGCGIRFGVDSSGFDSRMGKGS